MEQQLVGIRTVLRAKISKRIAEGKGVVGRRYQLEGEPLSPAFEACNNMPPEGQHYCGCGVTARAHRRKKGIGVDLHKAQKTRK